MTAQSLTLDPTALLELALSDADTAMTRLARTEGNGDLVDALYNEVSSAADMLVAKFDGCFDFWPDTTTPMSLNEPAVLGSTDGTMLSVLIPGTVDTLDAATLAIEVAREAGATLDNPSLCAEVHPARWLILNTCESATHDFHPELAPHGPRTPGAVLVTRVNFA